MKIVRIDEVPEQRRTNPQRQGVFIFRTLAEGEPGTPGNFLLQISQTGDDFFSPRHRHNFDQFRYQLEGEFDFDRDGKMTPGVLGYFPEGTHYGPQTSSVRSLTLVLQFGGASGNGYMTQAMLDAGTAELKKFGVFEKGVYRRNEVVDGKRNLDAYQAVWEHVNRRRMEYPEPRYSHPLLMDPASFSWVPVPGSSGVSDKLLGVFTERRTEACLLKLEPGARHRVAGRRLLFVTDGAGNAAGHSYGKHTTVFCDSGETVELVASAVTEILALGLPKLDAALAHTAAA